MAAISRWKRQISQMLQYVTHLLTPFLSVSESCHIDIFHHRFAATYGLWDCHGCFLKDLLKFYLDGFFTDCLGGEWYGFNVPYMYIIVKNNESGTVNTYLFLFILTKCEILNTYMMKKIADFVSCCVNCYILILLL